MMLDRRRFLQLPAAAMAAAAGSSEEMPMPANRIVETSTAGAMPVLFVSHGAPTLALDAVAGADFTRLGAAMPRPRAVLVVSAHWLDAPPTIGTRTPRPLLHDFAGFPRELDAIRYDAPVATTLAADLRRRLPELHVADERPWDHGVWVPLLHLLPAADVPVLQLSMPWRWTPRQMFALGERLAPLAGEGVLVLGSGGAVHNLRRLDWNGGPPAPWATGFEGWLRERLAARAFDDIVAYRDKAPDLALAHPTDDHFVPLLVAAGAAAAAPRAGDVTFPIEGFEYGSLSRLAVRFG